MDTTSLTSDIIELVEVFVTWFLLTGLFWTMPKVCMVGSNHNSICGKRDLQKWLLPLIQVNKSIQRVDI